MGLFSTSRKNKAQANILVIMFLVAVLVSVIISLVKFQKDMALIKHESDMLLMRYDLSSDVEWKISQCYGYPVVYRENVSCFIPTGLGDISVKGYSLEMIRYAYCPEKVVTAKLPYDYDDIITYPMPIRHGDLSCIGILKVYI